MAQVTWSILAIDKTRAAFASVNQGLRNLVSGGDQAQKKVLGLGLRMAGVGGIAVALGSQVRKVADDIRAVPGVDRDIIDSWDQLKFRANEASGAIQYTVARAGKGINSLAGLIRFGWTAAISGLDEAQRDLLEGERLGVDNSERAQAQRDKETDSVKKLSEARKAFKNIGETGAESIMRKRDEAAVLEKAASATADFAKKNLLLADAYKLRTEAEKDAVTMQKEMNDAQAKVAEGEGDISRVWQTSSKSLRELNAERAKTLRLLMDANNDFLGGDLTAGERAIRLNQKLVEIDKDRLQIMRKNKDMANEAGAIMSSAFEDAIFTGGNLREVLQGIASDLARMVFRNLITAPLAEGISGSLRGLFGGGKAAGGAVSAGTTYLVGENGPELFSPSSSGRITPNHQLNQGASVGGESFSFVYNIQSGVTRAELMPALKATQRATIAEIQSMRARRPAGMAYA